MNFLLAFWLRASCEIFYETNEKSDCIDEAFENAVGNLSGKYLSYGNLSRGNHDVKGDIDFHIT